MDLNGSHRKWPTSGRRCPNIEGIFLLFASMSVFSIMMLINVDVYKGGSAILWAGDLNLEQTSRSPVIRQMAMPAMKTIVAYSPEKQAEVDRKYPIFCDVPPRALHTKIQGRSWDIIEEPGTQGTYRAYNLSSAGLRHHFMRLRNVHQEGVWKEVPDTGISLYAGYYDDRIPQKPYTRILAVTNGTPIEDINPLYCQTWDSDAESQRGTPEVVEATITQIWWSEWDPEARETVTPLLISCALLTSRLEPFITTVTSHPCETAPYVLNVTPPSPSEIRRNFTVCVKDMNFEDDVSARLIEWFELLKLLGAEKIELYVGSVPDAVTRVLDHYSKEELALVHPTPRPPAAKLWQRRRDHLLAYNDCLYRNLRASRYIIPLDIDEVIVPRRPISWSQLLDDLKLLENEQPGAASLAVSNAFFFDSFNVDYGEDNPRQYRRSVHMNRRNEISGSNITVEMANLPHTLRHFQRSSRVSPAPEYSKSFVSTARALTVFNHYALSALGGAERARAVPVEAALLHHYKASCHPELVDCYLYTEASVRDDTLLRLAGDLIVNVNRVLNEV